MMNIRLKVQNGKTFSLILSTYFFSPQIQSQYLLLDISYTHFKLL